MTQHELKALEILKDGGRFVHRLESQYRGGDKFEYRLMPSTYRPKQAAVKGFGIKTFFTLDKAGLLERDFDDSLSGYESYRLRWSRVRGDDVCTTINQHGGESAHTCKNCNGTRQREPYWAAES